jgi:hypothetical protein
MRQILIDHRPAGNVGFDCCETGGPEILIPEIRIHKFISYIK